MAPRQETLQEAIRLRALVEDHHIKFKGPVPPSKWPTRHAHLFKVVRTIAMTSFDEFKSQRASNHEDILDQPDLKRVGELCQRVRKLCRHGKKLRKEINANESTWRSHIESYVIARFKEDARCPRCRHEVFGSEYRAQPFEMEEKKRLEKRRQQRRSCICDTRGYSGQSCEDSEEEDETMIFNTHTEQQVTHDPADVHLQSSGLSMKPDAVIGLAKTEKFKKYLRSLPETLTHCPLAGAENTIYPFLVIEAKREKESPGFRLIETQTAFPIRRLLKVQDRLREASSLNIDPLVWFLASRGDIWRLSAAVLNGNEVQVFDLWIDTVESQDGAFQICQIMDFIWSWAREVYRPQIHRCLRGSESLRLSPSSSIPFHRADSVISDLSLQSFSQFPQMEPNEAIFTQTQDPQLPQIEHASSHPLLQWTDTDMSRSAVIRQSNTVRLSFRALEVPGDEMSFRRFTDSFRAIVDGDAILGFLLRMIQKTQYSFLTRRRHLRDMEDIWRGNDSSTPLPQRVGSNLAQKMRVSVFFRTACQPEDWLITREIFCVSWTSAAAQLLGPTRMPETQVALDFDDTQLHSTQHLDVVRSLRQLHNLSGKQSTVYAFQQLTLLLTPFHLNGRHSMEWRFLQQNSELESGFAQFYISFETVLASADTLGSVHYHSSCIVKVNRPRALVESFAGVPTIPGTTGQFGAVLARRPDFFSSNCPDYCLFVLLEGSFHEPELKRMLIKTLGTGETFLGSRKGTKGPPTGTERQENKEFLSRWATAMRDNGIVYGSVRRG